MTTKEPMMQGQSLKACPFCGGDAVMEDDRLCWVVRCVSCEVTMIGARAPEPDSPEEEEATDWDALRQTAVAAWNRRARGIWSVGITYVGPDGYSKATPSA